MSQTKCNHSSDNDFIVRDLALQVTRFQPFGSVEGKSRANNVQPGSL